MNVYIDLVSFGRWIIVNANHPFWAWSGSVWVRHSCGTPTGGMQNISNFSNRFDAADYAQRFGFKVVEELAA